VNSLVPCQESEQPCVHVLGVSILPLSMKFRLDFETVPTLWYFSFVFLLYFFFQHLS
jgi:hypothetical protein